MTSYIRIRIIYFGCFHEYKSVFTNNVNKIVEKSHKSKNKLNGRRDCVIRRGSQSESKGDCKIFLHPLCYIHTPLYSSSSTTSFDKASPQYEED